MNDYLRPSYFRNKEDAMELCKIAKSLNEASPKVDLISTDNFVGFINVLTLLIGEL